MSSSGSFHPLTSCEPVIGERRNLHTDSTGLWHNTSAFSNLISDTCYVLSFAIIMLNTSLHNHNVRDKPTVERFISMNRGINEGGDLPEELLRVS